MNLKNPKQLILNNLEEEKSCFKELMAKLKEQKTAIASQDQERVLQIIEEKSALIEKFKKLEEEVETQLQLLSPKDMEGLAQDGGMLKESLESLLETIIRMEEECEEQIGSKMRDVEKRILGLQEGKKIGEGYGRYPKIRPLISKTI
ncbi:uncharacterized protein METZ01_LOCUS289105 [marine metagenome]|uniref:FlgN protein n=1 Tax=marine metagenome TaxID=408172 RepID=A0A382LMZ5_9ZZZZ